ncbi:ATP-binding protein [Streptomyces sp. NPDC005989]|uniref:ATP-binding protein n=1 Tax=Streptomyces sp. NPDC005989 TaxID=3156727 RepID=UPI0033FB27AD
MNETTQLPRIREVFHRRERRSVPLVRQFVREALVDWACDGRIDDVLLCVSELVTNALLHGVPPGRGFRLRLQLEPVGGTLRVEVHDSGDGEVRITDSWADSEEEGGRGLRLVAALADKWGVGERDPGKVVWCEFEVSVRSTDSGGTWAIPGAAALDGVASRGSEGALPWMAGTWTTAAPTATSPDSSRPS